MPTAKLGNKQAIDLPTARLIAEHAAKAIPAVRAEYLQNHGFEATSCVAAWTAVLKR